MNAALAWSGGFNLLPWRPRAIARARQCRLYEWGAALLLGLACAAVLAGWQAWQQRGLNAARAAVEHSLAQLHAPLAERGRLLRDEAARRQHIATAVAQSGPLTRLLDLFDVLGAARIHGIALQQITHGSRETLLQATVDDETSADAWLVRLRTVHDAQGVSVPELKRVALARRPENASDARANVRGNRAGRPDDAADANAPLQMTVRVLWKDAPDGASAVSVPALASAPVAAQSDRIPAK